MTNSLLTRRFVKKRGKKNRPEVALKQCAQCGRSAILASSFNVGSREKLFWFECPNNDCDSEAPLPLVSVAESAEKWNELQGN